MTEAIETISELSPLAAIVVIAGVAATVITQLAKRPSMTKQRAQLLAAVVSTVIGLLAYIVSGVATVFPAGFVTAVSTGVVVVAAVALTSRAAYAILGRAIPDGREHAAGGGTTVVNVTGTPESVEDPRALAEAVQKAQREGQPDGDA